MSEKKQTEKATEARMAKRAVMMAGRSDFREYEHPDFTPKPYHEGKELFGHVIREISDDDWFVGHLIEYNDRGLQEYPNSRYEIRLTKLDKNGCTSPNSVPVPISLVGKMKPVIAEADLLERILLDAKKDATGYLKKKNGTVFKVEKLDDKLIKVSFTHDGKKSPRAAVLSPAHFRALILGIERPMIIE